MEARLAEALVGLRAPAAPPALVAVELGAHEGRRDGDVVEAPVVAGVVVEGLVPAEDHLGGRVVVEDSALIIDYRLEEGEGAIGRCCSWCVRYCHIDATNAIGNVQTMWHAS